MYEFIEGEIAEIAPAYAVLNAGGVGYMLQISLQTFSAIEHLNRVRLLVHYVVREDAQLLYGFHTREERELFRLLIGVSGVGGNTARMILSTYTTAELQNIITSENAVLLKNVKGLGLKTAQKIIVELSGRMSGLKIQAAAGNIAGSAANATMTEAAAALVMLGFSKSAVDKALSAIFKENPQIGVEDAVRAGLKRL